MKKALIILLALSMLALLPACGGEAVQDDGDGSMVAIYRLVREEYRSGGSVIRAETLPYEDSDPEILVTGAAYALMSASGDPELTSALPRGVSIEEATLIGRTAYVCMDEAYLELSGIEKTITDACVTLTMCSIPQVDYAALHTRNEPASATLSTEDILLRNTMVSESTLELRLFFPKAEGEVLGAEYRQVSLEEDQTPERRVIDELLKGPESEALLPSIPGGVELLSVSTQDGLCTVSFTEDFLTGGSYDPQAIRLSVYSIVNSLTALSFVDQVQIYVRDNPEQLLGDLDISQPLSRRTSIIGSAVVE